MVLDRNGLDALLCVLAEGGRQVLGPRVRDGAVFFAPVRTTTDLPVGLQDETAPGRSRLVSRGDDALFAVTVGPGSLRPHLQRPRETLFTTTAAPDSTKTKKKATKKEPRALRVIADAPTVQPRAFFGVRPCDLAAVTIQDRVLLGGAAQDLHYAAARSDVVLVAASCTRAVDTCFCVSAGGGPQATHGHDLALTEVPRASGQGFDYVVDVGTPAGERLLSRLPASAGARPATDDDIARARSAVAAAARQRRSLPPQVATRLLERLDSPVFADVAAPCLSCASCTMVCPTCFCTTTEEHADLQGGTTRTRRWESCFTESHSHMHGGAVRPTTTERYRQWLTHKPSTWTTQFGTAGCTGCGRCIAWCPTGIDFVASAHRVAGDAATTGMGDQR